MYKSSGPPLNSSCPPLGINYEPSLRLLFNDLDYGTPTAILVHIRKSIKNLKISPPYISGNVEKQGFYKFFLSLKKKCICFFPLVFCKNLDKLQSFFFYQDKSILTLFFSPVNVKMSFFVSNFLSKCTVI